MWWLLSTFFAFANDIDIGYNPTVGKGEQPELVLTPSADVKEITVVIKTANGKEHRFVKENESAGTALSFTWKGSKEAEVTAEITCLFTDGYVAEAVLPMEFDYGTGLSVDYSSVKADSEKKELTVSVSGPVETVEVISYGANKTVLGSQELNITGGPGVISIPWIGEVDDTVLLDVTVRNENSFAGFTYSPWFLDVPHQDVLFESNEAIIPPSEEWKLDDTFKELEDVLQKYGELVPVKLYLAGCTDRVGSSVKNQSLSQRRAMAIAKWLRKKGYDEPIFVHGFGEGLLAVQTADGVDEAANRRVLYVVATDPPPARSGIPAVRWTSIK